MFNDDKETYDGTFYREIGNFIGERYLDYGFTRGTLNEVDFLEAELGVKTGDTVLDIGCGPGRHSLELARRGYLPFGIDISDAFIDLARLHTEQEHLNAEFMRVDARQFATDRKFDAAICICEGAFGLAGSDEGHMAVLRNVANHLRTGGRFILTAISALRAVPTAQLRHTV